MSNYLKNYGGKTIKKSPVLIIKYLLKHELINQGNSYLDLAEINKKDLSWLKKKNIEICPSKCKVSDFVGMNITSRELTDDPEQTLATIKNGWNRTKYVFAVYTAEQKSSTLGKILQNTLGIMAVPAAHGLFYFFKDKDLMEFYSFKIHDSNSENIKEDLLVYLALARLKSENILSSMPQILKDKIILHFGNNVRALAESRKLLKGLSENRIIDELCQLSGYGIQDQNAMWIHTALIKKLHPILRVYIGCSILFFGDPESADLVKIHKKSSKITYYLYDDFENKLLPEMHDRIKIDLRGQKINHFDHRSRNNPEVVYFKERFINKENSKYSEWNQFSKHLQINGYKPENIHIEQNKALTKILTDFCA